jgi:hypothetical protein
MPNRPLVVGGLAIAGAAGYYLYSAGGDPKVAEKKFERKWFLNRIVECLNLRVNDL